MNNKTVKTVNKYSVQKLIQKYLLEYDNTLKLTMRMPLLCTKAMRLL